MFTEHTSLACATMVKAHLIELFTAVTGPILAGSLAPARDRGGVTSILRSALSAALQKIEGAGLHSNTVPLPHQLQPDNPQAKPR